MAWLPLAAPGRPWPPLAAPGCDMQGTPYLAFQCGFTRTWGRYEPPPPCVRRWVGGAWHTVGGKVGGLPAAAAGLEQLTGRHKA